VSVFHCVFQYLKLEVQVEIEVEVCVEAAKSRCSCYNETIPIRVANETMQPQQQKQKQKPLFSQLMHMQGVVCGWFKGVASGWRWWAVRGLLVGPADPQ